MRSDFPLGAALGAMGYRNRIINPRFAIDQRLAGGSVTPAVDSLYCGDHWRARLSQASKFSVQQKQDNTFYNFGLFYNTLITSLAATALGVNDFYAFEQPVEGYLTSDFGWGGGTNPRPAMVQWVVQSSIPGALSGYVYNPLTNETAVWQAPVIANTPTKISVPILHNGANGLDKEANNSLVVGIGLGAGANFTAPAVTGWSASHKFSTPGDMGFITNAGATLRIGVAQLKPLPYVTPFDLVDPALEIEQCQRYYEKSYDLTTPPGVVTSIGRVIVSGTTDTGPNMHYGLRFKTRKRTDATAVFYNVDGTLGTWNVQSSAGSGTSSMNVQSVGETGLDLFTGFGTAWAAGIMYGHYVASAEF